MGGRIGGLVLVATLMFAPSSVAAGGQELIEGDPPLPIGCQDSFTRDLAMLCHPSTRLRGGSLTVTGFVRVDGARFPGGAFAFGQPPVSGRYIESHEPLLPGERLAARWSRLPPGSVLAARVADPLRGSRPLSFELDPATTSASLTVARGGRVTFVNGPSTRAIDVPPLAVGDPGGPAVPWAAGSPQDAVQAVIDHLDLDGPDDLAWLCAAIEPAERPMLGFGVPGAGLFARPAPDVDTAAQPADRCPLLEFAVFGFDNVPLVTGSTGAIVAVRSLGAGQAVVTATLTHRFRSSGSAPAPPGGAVTVTVPVLVTLTADGFWHVSTLEPLLPLFARDAAGESSDTELLAARSAALGDAQRALRELEHLAAGVRDRATSGVGHRPTCRGSKRSLIADPANDISVANSGDRTRNPRLATIDVHRASLRSDHGRLCLALVFAHKAPQAAAIELELSQTRHVSSNVQLRLGAATAIAAQGTRVVQPLVGVRVNRAGHRLSVSLPANAIRGPRGRTAIAWHLSVTGPGNYTAGYVDELPNSRHPGGPTRDAILRP